MTGGSYGQTLRRPGMQSFLWTQFLGAFNDNVCKIVVTFLTIELFQSAPPAWLKISDPTSAGAAIVGAVFILPFLLFSGYAGHVADVYSKRRVLISSRPFARDKSSAGSASGTTPYLAGLKNVA